MKRSGFKWKPRKPMKRSHLRVAGVSDTAVTKREIQSTLREFVILRDGGCLLRNSPEAGKCGSRETKSGELILQAEHLHTRANAASYADHRLVICLCERHHIFYKPQYADQYYEIVRQLIGKERSELLDRVKNDRTAHKVDMTLALIGLKQELKNLKEKLSTSDLA